MSAFPPKHRDPLGGFKLVAGSSRSASAGMAPATNRQILRSGSVGGRGAKVTTVVAGSSLSMEAVKRKMTKPPEINPGRMGGCGGITPRYSKDMFARLKKEQQDKKHAAVKQQEGKPQGETSSRGNSPKPPATAEGARSSSRSPDNVQTATGSWATTREGSEDGDDKKVEPIAFELLDSAVSEPKPVKVLVQAAPVNKVNGATSTENATSQIRGGSARALKLAIQQMSTKGSSGAFGCTSARTGSGTQRSTARSQSQTGGNSSMNGSSLILKPSTSVRSASLQSKSSVTSTTSVRSVRAVVAGGKRPASAHPPVNSSSASLPVQRPLLVGKNAPTVTKVDKGEPKTSTRPASNVPKTNLLQTRGRMPLRVGTPSSKPPATTKQMIDADAKKQLPTEAEVKKEERNGVSPTPNPTGENGFTTPSKASASPKVVSSGRKPLLSKTLAPSNLNGRTSSVKGVQKAAPRTASKVAVKTAA